MVLSILRKFALPALIAVSLPAIGCTYEAGPPVAYAGYEPQYYDGYVVYYDSYGAPYYYMDGGVYYVPRTYGRYDVLVDHYRVHRAGYRSWYAGGGYTYKRYHGSAPTHADVYHPASPHYHPAPHYRSVPAGRSMPRGHSSPRVHSGGGGHHHR